MHKTLFLMWRGCAWNSGMRNIQRLSKLTSYLDEHLMLGCSDCTPPVLCIDWQPIHDKDTWTWRLSHKKPWFILVMLQQQMICGYVSYPLCADVRCGWWCPQMFSNHIPRLTCISLLSRYMNTCNWQYPFSQWFLSQQVGGCWCCFLYLSTWICWDRGMYLQCVFSPQ